MITSDKDQRLEALGSEFVSSGKYLKAALNLYILCLVIVVLSILSSFLFQSNYLTILFPILLIIVQVSIIFFLFNSAENLITAGQYFNTVIKYSNQNSFIKSDSKNIGGLALSQKIIVGNYNDILVLVDEYKEDDYTNWRLPTFNELKLIIENKHIFSQKAILKKNFGVRKLLKVKKSEQLISHMGLETKLRRVRSAALFL